MGGFGSGRTPSRTKVEDYRALDVNRMHKAGLLNAGAACGWQWSVEGKRVAWINCRAETDGIRLIYKARQPGWDWESFDYRVPVEWIPCNFGGSRPYFLCPALKNGRGCFKRSSKLHGGAIFACRNCHDLSYASQSEDKLNRLYRKARKLRRKIDPTGDFEFIRRPKGMWNRTYDRAKGAYWEAEDEADELFTLIVGGKLGLLY
ncbi:Zn-finger protein [Labrenzia sp. EL_13]|nr:Zn-finger protein [Labrenzia sp. EL_13]